MVAALSILLLLAGTLAFAGAQAEESKKVVKVAFIGPLTGKYAKMGLGGRNSFQLAMDQQNASGKNKYINGIGHQGSGPGW